MKRPASTSRGPGGLADEAARAPSSLRGLLEDRELDEIERVVARRNDVAPDRRRVRDARDPLLGGDAAQVRAARAAAALRARRPQGQAPRLVRALPVSRHPARERRQGDDGRGPNDRGDPAIVRALQRRHRVGREAPARADQRLRARGEGADAWPPTGGASWNARSPRRSAPPASWSGASPASSDEFLHMSNRLPAAQRPAAGATCIDRG